MDISYRYSVTIRNHSRIIDEFGRNTRTTNRCATPLRKEGEELFSISYRNANRFVTELHVYKDEVDELWRTRENRERELFSWWKKGGSGHRVSDRICVSLWSCEERGVWLRVEVEIWMSVCKGHVSAFCGSLYQQQIYQSTDKSLFTLTLVGSRSFVL